MSSSNPKALQTALVTGASSGIGAAAARKLASEGLEVILVARRIDRLDALAAEIQQNGGKASVIQADLTQEADCRRVSTQCSQVDVLINNAGFGWYGFYSEMPWELARDMIGVNVAAAACLTRLFLPGMIARRSGHIINISSIAGGLPNQGIAVYSASKAFLDAFSTALHRELKGTGVTCTVIRPGPVATEFFPKAKEQPNGHPVPAESFKVSPERVAACIWRSLKTRRRVIYLPVFLWFSPWLEHLFGWIIDQVGPILLNRIKR